MLKKEILNLGQNIEDFIEYFTRKPSFIDALVLMGSRVNLFKFSLFKKKKKWHEKYYILLTACVLILLY